MRKLWYAGAGVIAGGFLLFGAAPAQAEGTSPDPIASVAPYADPLGDVLARTNGLRLSSPVGTDPLGRAPLVTLDQDGQRLFPIKPGQNDIAGYPLSRSKSQGQGQVESGDTDRRSLPAADVIGGSIHNSPGDRFAGSLKGIPFTDANTGSTRLPLLGRLPVVGGLLPDGSPTLESASSEYPLLDDLDGNLSVRGLPKRVSNSNRAVLAGLPLGGSPVAPADLIPEATPTASPYASAPARPGLASPSVAGSPSTAVSPSSEAPVAVPPSASETPAPSASVAPYTKSADPRSKVDDPRLLEEPLDRN
ncbi:hypothetical protein GCM10010168_00480 [Actinoplanes ianthinogenes]|uniref:Uncharacterized protein n=1 Tax=Actinoplanes ianthinogenes TaxID=122358 RepID=A0ABM7LV56_9ACTN|nr:hypothetical protein [Actinoplanes ianthinogenes]BCJ43210.1 hypothetical protein Aiant_38670 [Actinoplanes ianthinogenes]GGQ89477.1 hypothetical protein GCM10010168_00480 [Actinoplanes ianthinogenes]